VVVKQLGCAVLLLEERRVLPDVGVGRKLVDLVDITVVMVPSSPCCRWCWWLVVVESAGRGRHTP
jgi:hypothetical protein